MQDNSQGLLSNRGGRAHALFAAEGAKQQAGVTDSRNSSRAMGIDRSLMLVSVVLEQCKLDNSAIFEQQRVLHLKHEGKDYMLLQRRRPRFA